MALGLDRGMFDSETAHAAGVLSDVRQWEACLRSTSCQGEQSVEVIRYKFRYRTAAKILYIPGLKFIIFRPCFDFVVSIEYFPSSPTRRICLCQWGPSAHVPGVLSRHFGSILWIKDKSDLVIRGDGLGSISWQERAQAKQSDTPLCERSIASTPSGKRGSWALRLPLWDSALLGINLNLRGAPLAPRRRRAGTPSTSTF